MCFRFGTSSTCTSKAAIAPGKMDWEHRMVSLFYGFSMDSLWILYGAHPWTIVLTIYGRKNMLRNVLSLLSLGKTSFLAERMPWVIPWEFRLGHLTQGPKICDPKIPMS